MATAMADWGRGGARPLADQLCEIVDTWARSQYELVVLSAKFANSAEWVLAGSPTAAHWLATVADVQVCTAREWIRIGRKLNVLPAIADAFEAGDISYSKVRTLTRLATPANEAELVELAKNHSAADLGRAMAAWMAKTMTPEEIEDYQHRQRSARWRTAPDGMVHFSLRLPPRLAGLLITFLTTWVMRTRPGGGAGASSDAWPSVAQQYADAFESLLNDGAGEVDTEVIVHVRGDGNTLDDGTPLADSVVAELIPKSFIRALIHDSEQHPIDATNRRRHPTTRQRRLVKERDRVCVDCGRADLLQYDHVPAHETTGHTVSDELKLRCAPCHHRRHKNDDAA